MSISHDTMGLVNEDPSPLHKTPELPDELYSFAVEKLNGGGVLVTQIRRGDVPRGAPIRRAIGANEVALIEYLTELAREMYD